MDEKPIRWWPLLAIWIISAGLWCYAYGTSDANRQDLVMKSFAIGFFAIVLSLIWLLAFSRLRWKIRFTALAIALLSVFLFAGLFRFEGFSGDLVPVFGWRWAEETARDKKLDTELSQPVGPIDKATINDFTQFFGSNRDGKISGVSLDRDWISDPPELLWRQPIGEAWSGFAVSNSKAITQEQDEDRELVVCYDLLTGKALWQHSDVARYDDALGGVGPRATPTIEGNRVYTLGATGILNCLDLRDGSLLWGLNILKENDAKLPDWGTSSSPLIYGELVVVSAGGRDGRSLVAYNKTSGDFVWGGGSEPAHWSSPVAYEIGGKEQILIFNRALTSHDPDNGNVLWSYPWKRDHPHVSIPLLLGSDRVMLSSGYGNGSALLQITANEDVSFSVERLWKTLHMKAKFTNLVSKDGYVYGLDDGIMACLDIETGRRAWKTGRYGHGQVLLLDDLLLVSAENREILLLEATPVESRVLTRFQALTGKSWNPPALVAPFLLVRNHKEAACYKLPLN